MERKCDSKKTVQKSKRGHVWCAGNTARRLVVWAEWAGKEMTHREGRESDHSGLWTTVKISDFTLREGKTQVGVEGVEKKRTWFDFKQINILLWGKNEGANPYKDHHGTSLVVQYYCSPPRYPFPIKSLALSAKKKKKKNPPASVGNTGSIPGPGTKLSYAVEQLNLCVATTEAQAP